MRAGLQTRSLDDHHPRDTRAANLASARWIEPRGGVGTVQISTCQALEASGPLQAPCPLERRHASDGQILASPEAAHRCPLCI